MYAIRSYYAAKKMKELKDATGITYPLAFDDNADIFGLYALKEAGVTRNVIVGKDGKIKYLTRLYNREDRITSYNVCYTKLLRLCHNS